MTRAYHYLRVFIAITCLLPAPAIAQDAAKNPLEPVKEKPAAGAPAKPADKAPEAPKGNAAEAKPADKAPEAPKDKAPAAPEAKPADKPPEACKAAWFSKLFDLKKALKPTPPRASYGECALTGETKLELKGLAAGQYGAFLDIPKADALSFPIAGEDAKHFRTVTIKPDKLEADSPIEIELLDPLENVTKNWGKLHVRVVKKNGVATLTLVDPEAKEDKAKEDKAKEDKAKKCAPANFAPLEKSPDDVFLSEHCQDRVCITPSGKVYGLTELSEDLGSVDVELWAPHSQALRYSLNVDYERIVLKNGGLKNTGEEDKDVAGEKVFGQADSYTVKLSSAGKLHITVSWEGGGEDSLVRFDANKPECVPEATGTVKKTLTVSGHYHFMLGFMPTYAGLYDREHTLHRSDDGVQRLFQQDVREIDYAATLSAYPWGVDEENDSVAVGALLGTSIRNPGKRWYFGLEVSTPINIGLVGGMGLIVVDALDNDFEVGQPLEDSSFPTHSTVVPTWFVGINIEAELFKKAFKGIAGND